MKLYKNENLTGFEFSNWDIAETSPFESKDDCIIFALYCERREKNL